MAIGRGFIVLASALLPGGRVASVAAGVTLTWKRTSVGWRAPRIMEDWTSGGYGMGLPPPVVTAPGTTAS